MAVLGGMGTWVLSSALAAMPGESLPGQYPFGATYGLLAAGIASAVVAVMWRENDRLHAVLAELRTRERRQEADVQRLHAQLENLNAVLTVRNRQLQETVSLRQAEQGAPADRRDIAEPVATLLVSGKGRRREC